MINPRRLPTLSASVLGLPLVGEAVQPPEKFELVVRADTVIE